MKKKFAGFVCTLALVMAMTTPVMAGQSPSGRQNRTPVPSKSTTAPKTGESDMLMYGSAAALLLAGTTLVSWKKSR